MTGYLLCSEMSHFESERILDNWFRYITLPKKAKNLILYTQNKLMKYDTNLLLNFLKYNRNIKKVTVFAAEMTEGAEKAINNLSDFVAQNYNMKISVDVCLQPALAAY